MGWAETILKWSTSTANFLFQEWWKPFLHWMIYSIWQGLIFVLLKRRKILKKRDAKIIEEKPTKPEGNLQSITQKEQKFLLFCFILRWWVWFCLPEFLWLGLYINRQLPFWNFFYSFAVLALFLRVLICLRDKEFRNFLLISEEFFVEIHHDCFHNLVSEA